MTTRQSPKLLPRNVAALRAGLDPAAAVRTVPGNPVSTRLESGIGNFFPGLECDLRNLERRFFPFLEVDTDFRTIAVVSVDVAGAASANAIAPADLQSYRTLDQDTRQNRQWFVRTIDGDFGPLGRQTITLSALAFGQSFGSNREPADAFVAIRLLKENSLVTLTLNPQSGSGQIVLTGRRAAYLDANGALARMFEPGELTQSLCSPWTHDFRDCSCYYWASNHPDIALPPLPNPQTPTDDRKWQTYTAWERADRSLQSPPVETDKGTIPEMLHNEINRNWPQLNFVLDRREQIAPYKPSKDNLANAPRLPDLATLLSHLRFAAGVELAVALEYLSAAWSLKKPAGLPPSLSNDLKAAFAEIRRIAIGEMRHIRAVNDVLAGLSPPGTYEPALAVASEIPEGAAGNFRALQFRPASLATIDDFIEIEKPSESVDGLYAPIFVTLRDGLGSEEQVQSIRTVMSEGEDHFQTFQFVREWLGRHTEAEFLIGTNIVAPSPGDAAHQTLQARYLALLQALHAGYKAGMPMGAATVNAARNAMLGPGGIEGALDAVAATGRLAVFDPIADPRFAPIARP